MQCLTCHADAATAPDFKAQRDVTTLYFPPQKAAAKQVVLRRDDLPERWRPRLRDLPLGP